MKRTLLSLLVGFFAFHTSHAFTNITTTSVSGHWTMAGSPYYIMGNLSVDSGTTLAIDPGVQVLFKGAYSMTVWGSLAATGTAALPISFDVYDTTGWSVDILNMPTYAGGWRGITMSKYNSTAADVSSISYCKFMHMRYSSVAVLRSMRISNCYFTDNRGGCIDLGGSDATATHELAECNFYNNKACYGALINAVNADASWYVHDNNLYNNTVDRAGSIVNCQGTDILFSGNSIYDNTILPLPLISEDAHIVNFSTDGTKPCNAVIRGNYIYKNSLAISAALYCHNISADIDRNYICNNYHLGTGVCAHALGGGGMFLLGTGDYNQSTIGLTGSSIYIVRNNVIANNYSELYGGGIYLYDAKCLIANNTIVNNKSPEGSAIDMWNVSTVTTACIRNNIFYGNTSTTPGFTGNIHVTSLGNTRLKYDHNWSVNDFSTDVVIPFIPGGHTDIIGDTLTNIKGINPGLTLPTTTANYTQNALSADFSLTASSACINKGTDEAVSSRALDFSGNNRIISTADIGAYEFNSSSAPQAPAIPNDTAFAHCCTVLPPQVLALQQLNVSVNNAMSIYPNPASHTVFIRTAETKGSVVITDITGRQVLTANISSTLTGLNVDALPAGHYHAAWYDNNQQKGVAEMVVH